MRKSIYWIHIDYEKEYLLDTYVHQFQYLFASPYSFLLEWLSMILVNHAFHGRETC